MSILTKQEYQDYLETDSGVGKGKDMNGNKILAGPQPELMAMYAQGKKTFEIAEKLYTSTKTVSRWQKEQGLAPIRGPVHKISPAKADLIREWKQQGVSDNEIARRLGVERKTVFNFRKREGIEV